MVADDGTGQQVTIPVEADFLYVYSCADGLYVTVCDGLYVTVICSLRMSCSITDLVVNCAVVM